MNVQIEESWKAHLQPEFEKDYFRTLTDFVRDEYGKYAIYPPGKLIFNAFNLCPFDKVKVVIIGQDPYHGPGQAHGLCFSVNDGVPFPPSLLNIFKEIKNKVQPFEGVNFILYDGINVYQIRCILCSLHSLRISSGQMLACISPI